MLFEIMVHIKNFFPTDKSEEAEYTIKDGTISLPFVLEGQYIRVEGSIFNDGVYQYPMEDLTDETFHGFITVLAPPPAFIALASEIETYQSSYKESPYQSESFGGYSYSKESGGNGSIISWHDVFRSRLNAWRKI